MKKNRMCMITVGLLLCIFCVLVGVMCSKDRAKYEKDFLNKEYDGVFASMLNVENFLEEDFLNYRGLKIVKTQYQLTSFKDCLNMMQAAYKCNEGLTHIYMEIDPMILWNDANKNQYKWDSSLEKCLIEIVCSNPNTTFEMLLPYPEIVRLIELSDEEWNEYEVVYKTFVSVFEGMPNVLISYLGNEQWLNSNAGNYVDTGKLNLQVERHVFKGVFCDQIYLINTESLGNKFEELRELVLSYKEKVELYPDFSEWKFVFLGDSIIGIDRSSKSIPGVVNALTKANTYNCAKNGTAAAKVDDEVFSVLSVTEALSTGNMNEIYDEELSESILQFLEGYTTNDKLCFFVNLGLNDYFLGYAVENEQDPLDIKTYIGAMRNGIEQLQEAYPESKIVVLIPTYVYAFSEGTLLNSEDGQVLQIYRDAVLSLAEEMNLYCKDNYRDMGIDASNYMIYLSDECHLNEKGRFLFGEQLVMFLKENVIK